MGAWKGPQVAYPSARSQSDKDRASLLGACLYMDLYAGSVWISVVQWRCLDGAAGSVHWYILLGTHSWCLLAVVHFISIFQNR